MPPKKDAKGAKGGKGKDAKSAKPSKGKEGGASGGKAKKKKWSKGKVREKLNNLVMWDKSAKDKLYQEVPKYKVITTSIVSDRLKVNGSLARQAIKLLQKEGLIKPVSVGSECSIFTRNTKQEGGD
eukprot:NODE_10699_length_497_cov_231.786096_g10048_i0.p1 GENE.NODE_10699_length_497_cov_231.786096_g10048_i0~~NODE_10699_length_497_cov_231.786096_g10048_i0.p1  ORF type:complete len:126 (+),score=44.73 NODE_10699_length_497_cov_231.786096_g10048_i0:60-437(+)